MSNFFAALPVPAGNGAGAPVDVSAAGSLKALVIAGAFDAALNVEVSEDGVTYETAATYTGPTTALLDMAAQFMRVVISGYVSGTPVVAVGAIGTGGAFAALAVPAGNGVGAPTNVSAMGIPKTLVVGGPFEATVTIEISEDGVTFGAIPGVPSFSVPDLVTTPVIAAFMRVRVSGYVSGTPVVAVGAVADLAAAFAAFVAATNAAFAALALLPQNRFSGAFSAANPPVIFGSTNVLGVARVIAGQYRVNVAAVPGVVLPSSGGGAAFANITWAFVDGAHFDLFVKDAAGVLIEPGSPVTFLGVS
jgi:hypothetical protein